MLTGVHTIALVHFIHIIYKQRDMHMDVITYIHKHILTQILRSESLGGEGRVIGSDCLSLPKV